MRTTITLDESTAELIQEEMRRSGKTLEERVNEAIHTGLTAKKAVSKVPFQVDAKPLGLKPRYSYDKVSELIEQIEGPFHR